MYCKLDLSYNLIHKVLILETIVISKLTHILSNVKANSEPPQYNSHPLHPQKTNNSKTDVRN